MNERYSIEVTDEMVLIYGMLTMREAFDFLAFFDQQGFKSVVVGHENSTLCLIKDCCIDMLKGIKENLHKNDEVIYKEFYKKEKEKNEKLNEFIAQLTKANDYLHKKFAVSEAVENITEFKPGALYMPGVRSMDWSYSNFIPNSEV